MSDDVKVALIAAGVSISIWVLSFFFEPLKEKITCLLKLNIEHKYNEKKKIKEIISKYKMQLLYACEELNYRMWNLYKNYNKKWCSWDGSKEGQIKGYYFYSFIYRLCCFYGWINKIENDMTFIDMQVADKGDLEFLKYLRIFHKIPCNALMITQYDDLYNGDVATDHFFYNNLKEFCNRLSEIDFANDGVFKEFCRNNETIFSQYINETNPNEKRYRWDMMEIVHLVVMAFLNTYGYDYQYTITEKYDNLFKNTYIKKSLWPGFFSYMSEFRMDKQKEMKRLIRIMKKYV